MKLKIIAALAVMDIISTSAQAVVTMQTGSTVSPQVREKACEIFFVDTVRKRGESHLAAKFENRYIYKKYLSECSSVSTPNVINYVQNLYWGADVTPPPKKYGIQVTSSLAEYKARGIWKKAVKKAQEEVNKSLPGSDDPDAGEAALLEADMKMTKEEVEALNEEGYDTQNLDDEMRHYYCTMYKNSYDYFRTADVDQVKKDYKNIKKLIREEIKKAQFISTRCKDTVRKITPEEYVRYQQLLREKYAN